MHNSEPGWLCTVRRTLWHTLIFLCLHIYAVNNAKFSQVLLCLLHPPKEGLCDRIACNISVKFFFVFRRIPPVESRLQSFLSSFTPQLFSMFIAKIVICLNPPPSQKSLKFVDNSFMSRLSFSWFSCPFSRTR